MLESFINSGLPEIRVEICVPLEVTKINPNQL